MSEHIWRFRIEGVKYLQECKISGRDSIEKNDKYILRLIFFLKPPTIFSLELRTKSSKLNGLYILPLNISKAPLLNQSIWRLNKHDLVSTQYI
jgi:hypothetical protein